MHGCGSLSACGASSLAFASYCVLYQNFLPLYICYFHLINASADFFCWKQVKVCDICGDAGREDLLAICSRCSDGAEHT